jgi:hypothetical protein
MLILEHVLNKNKGGLFLMRVPISLSVLALLTAPAHACCGGAGLIILPLMLVIFGGFLVLICGWCDLVSRWSVCNFCPYTQHPQTLRWLSTPLSVCGYFYMLFAGYVVQMIEGCPLSPFYAWLLATGLITTTLAMAPSLLLGYARKYEAT